MTTRHGIYVASGIAAAGLITELLWFAIDPKGDARQHITDRLVRVLNRARGAGF